ncbi:hypothetical protein [Micromonospora cremea]|uniref:hypothetical protein n=1 Tax=Micromonospora cremea TaxID=709881 RepID=UPI001180A648|nr:hypothetical protein [Micromonospora cremea]
MALLFLHNIQSLSFECDDGSFRMSRIRDENDPTRVALECQVDGDVSETEHWWVYGRTMDREDLAGRRVEVAFQRSGPEAGAPFERPGSSPLVAYFPTDKETRLGFLLQAPFRTTPARDNVPERDPLNIALIDEATGLLVNALQTLRDDGLLDLDVLDALPIDPGAFPEGGLLRRLFDGVRDALRDEGEAFFPTADGGFYVSIDLLRLPRGAGIRELLSPELLGRLVGADEPVCWPPAELSYERHRTLWDYLNRELGVAVITPDWLVGHLNPEFLSTADDGWLIRLYAVLARSPHLLSQLRRMPSLIRLEDGSHAAAFGADDRPGAYLPGPTPSEYPTVRRTIVADATARHFLTSLGLKEPDLVDEVLDKVLPRYRGSTVSVDDTRHRQDLDMIQQALRDVSRERRSALVEQLRQTAIVRARASNGTATAYRLPRGCYWADEDLEHYFKPTTRWFLGEDYEPYRAMLTELGVSEHVYVAERLATAAGYVVDAHFRGFHQRGIRGFDPDLDVDGLDAALANPDLRRSAYVWNRLLARRADRLRGFVETATRATYENATRRRKVTLPYRYATEHAWLPAPAGGWARPDELCLEDLPAEFQRHQGLADALGMISSEVEQLSSHVGLPVDMLRFLAENPEIRTELERKMAKALATAKPSTENISEVVAALDYAAELASAFARPSDGVAFDDDAPAHGHGQIGVPDLRRQRTVVDIADAREAEPLPADRHRVLPRKVWDAKDTAVRPFLMEQYAGRCQICDDTFPKRDGQPYFEAVSLVPYTKAAWVDRPGNALCLCATCAAKLLHGDVAGLDVLDQIRSWRTKVDGGDEAVLHLVLCGQPHTLNYTEKHLLDLQILLTEAEMTHDRYLQAPEGLAAAQAGGDHP